MSFFIAILSLYIVVCPSCLAMFEFIYLFYFILFFKFVLVLFFYFKFVYFFLCVFFIYFFQVLSFYFTVLLTRIVFNEFFSFICFLMLLFLLLLFLLLLLWSCVVSIYIILLTSLCSIPIQLSFFIIHEKGKKKKT